MKANTATAELINESKEISVLLIEDSAGDAFAIMQALSREGVDDNLRVRRKSRLADGLEFLKENQVDVVMVDLNLPDASGMQSVMEVSSQHPHLPIIVITGQDGASIAQHAMLCGAQEFLMKGECSGRMMRQCIFQALARRQLHNTKSDN